MLLTFHIIVATSSIIYTAFVFVAPSKNRLTVAYILVALMLVSGVGLMVQFPAQMTQTCLEGLIFLVFVGAGILAARKKLIKQHARNSLV